MRVHKSHARNIAMTHMGGEVFTVNEEASDNAVLWGELFGGKERKFLRELLSSQTVCFTLKDTYQIFVRTLFHSQAFVNNNAGSGMRRAGKFVLFLHSLDGDLTSGWTWAKFIRPMYRNKFSIVLVDLPGFGKSMVSQTSYVKPSRWKEFDFHIISKILEELGIPKCHICAVGSGCGILVNMLQRAPHRLEDEHFMFNAELDRDELFAHVGIDPEPGAPAGWQERVRERQQKALTDLMRKTGVKLWLAFDRGVSYGTDDRPVNEKRKENWKRQYDTHTMFTIAARNQFVGSNTVITEVMRADICDAQFGQQVKVKGLIPSRNLKASLAKYLAKQNNAKWAANFTPHHKKQINERFRYAQLRTRAIGSEYDFGDSDSDDGGVLDDMHGAARDKLNAEESKARKDQDLALLSHSLQKATGTDIVKLQEVELSRQTSPVSRPNTTTTFGSGGQSLALMDGGAPQALLDGDPTMKELDVNLKSSDDHSMWLEFQRTKRALEDRMKRSRSSFDDKHQSKRLSNELERSLFHSSSASAVGNTKMESGLLSSSNFARQLLKSRGARPETGQPLPPSTKHREEFDWTLAPFEHDLSYGVRNMFMQAFENSVQSFKDEEDARVARHKNFHVRRGFHRASAQSFQSRNSRPSRAPSE